MLKTADTTVFKSNRTQAVRFPKDVAFPESVKAVRIIRQGKARLVVPIEALWDDFFERPGIEDWPDREPQPDWPTRESW